MPYGLFVNRIIYFRLYQARIEWVLLKIFSRGVSLNKHPPKNGQTFAEKAHYPNATPLKISIRTHSIPAWIVYGKYIQKAAYLFGY